MNPLIERSIVVGKRREPAILNSQILVLVPVFTNVGGELFAVVETNAPF